MGNDTVVDAAQPTTGAVSCLWRALRIPSGKLSMSSVREWNSPALWDEIDSSKRAELLLASELLSKQPHDDFSRMELVSDEVVQAFHLTKAYSYFTSMDLSENQ
jgi:hypothetical protein